MILLLSVKLKVRHYSNEQENLPYCRGLGIQGSKSEAAERTARRELIIIVPPAIAMQVEMFERQQHQRETPENSTLLCLWGFVLLLLCFFSCLSSLLWTFLVFLSSVTKIWEFRAIYVNRCARIKSSNGSKRGSKKSTGSMAKQVMRSSSNPNSVLVQKCWNLDLLCKLHAVEVQAS